SSEIDVNREIIRLEPQGIVITSHCFVNAALAHERKPEAVVRVGIIGVEKNGLAEMGFSLNKLSLIVECDSQDVMRTEVIGPQLQGLFVLDNRLVVSFQTNKDIGQVDVGVRMIRLQLH